ncbi:MAG TPA: hypothetical protein VHK47_17375, partial [Polyangia bacterium]|nr:hypothetical protein [Polyangia bacterium]
MPDEAVEAECGPDADDRPNGAQIRQQDLGPRAHARELGVRAGHAGRSIVHLHELHLLGVPEGTAGSRSVAAIGSHSRG